MRAEDLVQAAGEAREAAYAPYSKYKVGAALITSDGTVFRGVNVENASYGLTICAERNAIAQAVGAGHREFRALAVVTRDGASLCGACRQVLFEFAPTAVVYLADPSGAFRETSAEALLPQGFSGDRLSN